MFGEESQDEPTIPEETAIEEGEEAG